MEEEWEKVTKDSFVIAKGTVVAYKKSRLVLENDTCGEQVWGSSGCGTSKDLNLLFCPVPGTCPIFLSHLYAWPSSGTAS